MCFYSKKCVLTSDLCPLYSNTFYPSAATDIFYPDLIQFGPSGTNQPTNLITRTKADVMFRLVYSFAVNATVFGKKKISMLLFHVHFLLIVDKVD